MNTSFNTKELDNFEKQMVHLAVSQFPKETKKFMKTEAGKLRQQAVKHAKTKTKKKTGNYIKGFKKGKKVYKFGDADYNIMVQNSAPHAHLIEEGHNITTKEGKRGKGKVTGHVKGLFVLDTASQRFEDEFNKDIGNLQDFIAKELEK